MPGVVDVSRWLRGLPRELAAPARLRWRKRSPNRAGGTQ